MCPRLDVRKEFDPIQTGSQGERKAAAGDCDDMGSGSAIGPAAKVTIRTTAPYSSGIYSPYESTASPLITEPTCAANIQCQPDRRASVLLQIKYFVRILLQLLERDGAKDEGYERSLAVCAGLGQDVAQVGPHGLHRNREIGRDFGRTLSLA